MKNIFVKGIVLGYLFLLMASCNTNGEKSASVLIDKEQTILELRETVEVDKKKKF